ncbi:thiamine diphosphokinase [Wohlfahrtiimonas sp. G9077]|uniref:thiamine diphosphokinase n=1 Tax=Wohlfahrtiimonas sp. G9077 TaxID=1980118 RepID=UPI000B989B14|nr:thiamine diphosphokinase [Wohlfahrtiimonas sp. G9077]OYQ75341.1 thiamine diphosphokinase [Wohlfahrtiimonas sp. G9077]
MYARLILLLPGPVHYSQLNLSLNQNDYIIAVDGGIEHVKGLNVTPNLWVGDFDSCKHDDHQRYLHLNKETHPTDKDYLDTELALSKAESMNITECILIGGIGGLIDHQMGLFMLPCAHPSLKFIHTDGKTKLYSLNHACALAITQEHYHRLSIVPITTLQSVTTRGVKWPLTDATLPAGFGRSLSNQITESTLHYTQKDGIGWIILS